MLALIVLVFVHRWIPEARWLLVHMVTLGLLTTSIMIWGQHFADALLRTRTDDRGRARQVLRIRLLTLAIIVVCFGMLGAWPIVTAIGAAGVIGAVAWFAASLASQMRRALPSRFRMVVRGYVIAALWLGAGGVLGGLLGFSPASPWHERLMLAHMSANVLGFVGTTALMTLMTLGPTVLHVRLTPALERCGRWILVAWPLAAGTAVISALVGSGTVIALGLAIHVLLLAWLLVALALAARSAPWGSLPLFPPLSIGAGLVWLLGALIAAIVLVGPFDPTSGPGLAHVQALTAPLVAGFGLQLLLGAMSHLMPTVMGGGPRAVRAGLAELSRWAVARVVLVNACLALFVSFGWDQWAEATGAGTWTRVALSLGAFVGFAAFLPLMIRSVRASVRERRAMMAAAADGTVSSPQGGADRADIASGEATHRSSARTVQDSSTETSPPRRSVAAGAAVGAVGALGLLAAGQAVDRAARGGAGPSADAPVTPSGRTVRATIRATEDMRFVPDHVEAQRGDRLELTVKNEDPSTVHDLLLSDGSTTGRIAPGKAASLVVGAVPGPLEGWCTVVGHRGMGMTFAVTVPGAAASQPSAAPARNGAAAPVHVDLTAHPGPGYRTRSADLPAPTPQSTFTVIESVQEVAPGVRMRAMTYNGRVMGPILRGTLGGPLAVHLVNKGTMGHSLDLHAGTVSPDQAMRTIPPGASLDYPIRTDHAGIWLYHCSTMPMSVHLAAGMFGALVVPPAGVKAVDREWVLVQSEGYLGEGAASDKGAEVDTAKIAEERPDVILWNGHANQYVHAPLKAKVGERIRIWVLAAGPSRGISFHVVGGVFDTVFKEGAYLLRADDATGGGSQALDLAPAQGGFVELTFREPGTYTAVNHSFVDMEKGARALIVVTE